MNPEEDIISSEDVATQDRSSLVKDLFGYDPSNPVLDWGTEAPDAQSEGD